MSKTKVISGRIATVEVALACPDDFELSFTWLGWTLSYLGDPFSTYISESDAERVIDALKCWRNLQKELRESVN
jgi:hypothetical protein